MKATNEMVHYHLGGGTRSENGLTGGSILGLPVVTDDEGTEFVYYKGVLTHVDEVPLPKHTTGLGQDKKWHRVEMGSRDPKPKRVPVVRLEPQIPTDAKGKPLPAFAEVQRVATTIHPDSPMLKEKENQ